MKEKIAALSLQKAFLGGIIALAFYWMAFYDNGDRLRKNIATTQQNIKKLNGDLNQLRGVSAQLKQKEVLFGEVQGKLMTLDQIIPKEVSDSEIMGEISNEAKAAGANIANITSSRGNAGGSEYYTEIGIEVSLEATYTQVMVFLSFLTKLKKLLVLKEIQMATLKRGSDQGADQLISFRGRLVTYKQNTKEDSTKK